MAPQPTLLATPQTFGVVSARVLIDIVCASTLYFVPSPQVTKPFHNQATLTPLISSLTLSLSISLSLILSLSFFFFSLSHILSLFLARLVSPGGGAVKCSSQSSKDASKMMRRQERPTRTSVISRKFKTCMQICFSILPPAWRHGDVDRVDSLIHRMILIAFIQCTIWHLFPVRLFKYQMRTSWRTFMFSFVLVRKGVLTPSFQQLTKLIMQST